MPTQECLEVFYKYIIAEIEADEKAKEMITNANS